MTNKNKALFVGIVTVILATIVFVVFTKRQRSNENHIDGGLCKYDTLILSAKVVGIRNLSDTLVDLDLAVAGRNDLTDTISYSQQPGMAVLRKSEIKSIEVGDSLRCTCFRIRSGTCSPYIYAPTLEKFSAER